MNNHKITNLATPTADTDAATKAYVDEAPVGTLSCAIYTGSAYPANTVYCPDGYTATGGGATYSNCETYPSGNGQYCHCYTGTTTCYVRCCEIK